MPSEIEKIFQKEDRRFTFRQILRRVFLNDWLIKLLAMLITVGLWLGVTGLRAPTTARMRSVPLNIRVGSEIEITNAPVQEVDLVITGDKRKIDQMNPRDLVVSLDLSDIAAGDRAVQITPENVNVELPNGVKLEEVQPSKIAVKLEKVAEREIAVRAETEGDIADNLEIYSETVLPNRVRVRGPESFVKTLDFISTEKISLENRTADFTVRQVALNVVNPKITLLDTAFDVTFRIGEKRVERMFTVPVQAENKKAMVILFGGRSIIESLKTENLRVENVKNEAGENVLKLILPPEIQDKIEVRKLSAAGK
ncbi:MAG: CdaR family protein [Acidobacteriota bacterium]|nr:CdaR family protein [Acidobacteriota bacterium]